MLGAGPQAPRDSQSQGPPAEVATPDLPGLAAAPNLGPRVPAGNVGSRRGGPPAAPFARLRHGERAPPPCAAKSTDKVRVCRPAPRPRGAAPTDCVRCRGTAPPRRPLPEAARARAKAPARPGGAW